MKATKSSKKTYTRHSVEYKTEALKLAERIGVPEAARQLGLHESQLYQWRNQQHQQSVSQRKQEQATEIARLRRELAVAQEEVAILKKASAYFARQIK